MKERFFLKVTAVFLAVSAALFLASCSHEALYSGAAVAGYDSKWTTVVYMAADNDLEGAAIDDFREMMAGAAGLGEAGHTVLVLFDRSEGYDASAANWSDTRLFKLEPCASPSAVADFSFMQLDCSLLGLTKGTETELDMSSSETLRNVLQFAQNSFPAQHYALVMWGHGCGWRGYAVDEKSDGLLSLPALHKAVSELEYPLSVIAFDCCYGAMLETAYELQNDAQVLVATERDEPAAGWNYTYLLESFAQKGSPASFSSDAVEGYAGCIVNAFGKQYASQSDVSISAIRLDKTGDVFSCFDVFSKACASCLATREAAVSFSSNVISGAVTFLTGEYPAYRFIDILSLCDSFRNQSLSSCPASLRESALSASDSLEAALRDATLLSFTGGSGFEDGMSQKPMLAVYLATVRSGGVVDAEYPLLYVRGSGAGGQSSFVRDSTGWVPQSTVTQSTSLLDHLYRMPLP